MDSSVKIIDGYIFDKDCREGRRHVFIDVESIETIIECCDGPVTTVIVMKSGKEYELDALPSEVERILSTPALTTSAFNTGIARFDPKTRKLI